MSKRPAAGGGASSGSGGRRGVLRDRPIWVKLGLIMIVPTIATVFVGFSALLTNIRGASDAATVQSVAALDAQIGSLSDALQSERAAANTLLGEPPSKVGDAQKRYESLFAATDQAAAAYRTRRTAVGDLNSSFTATLQSVDTALSDLPSVRNQATQRAAAKDSVVKRYESIIDGLLSTRQASALIAGDSDVNQALQLAGALSSYKEALAQERIKVDDLTYADSVSAAQISDVYATVARQEYALRIFTNLTRGSDDDAYFARTTEDGTSTQRAAIEQQVLTSVSPQAANLHIDRTSWDDLVDSHMVKLRTAEQHFDDKVTAGAKALHANKQQQVLVEAGLLLLLVVVAVAIAWMMARSMNRSLRELRHGALAIAQYGLPQAVARLRDPSLNTALSPHQIAQQIADPLPVRSHDEFGQVTEAFNAVHLEAVRTAAEQAALRSSVATMFVNLARRSQILVDRLIGHLDRLERGEEDPDRLADLFQLDHLATRMRRNDENLLVLAGADSTRVQRDPAALIDVLRAAQSEVEHYTRIEFGVIDRDIEIAAHSVNDLVHLVAELFDNATAFSPPDSTVVVEARRVGDRAVLYVEDHGIGMSSDQMADLNDRLTKPPQVDVAVSRMMGLVVVARLAARHEVKVELRPARERGTIADVLLPTGVLVPRALSGRGPGTSLPGHPLANQAGRGPGNAPLALESGSAEPGRRSGQSIFGAFPAGAAGGEQSEARSGFGAFEPDAPAQPARPTAANIGGPFDPANNGAPGARNLPSWSDLTGAGPATLPGEAGRNGAEGYPPRPGENLPHRRSGENGGEPEGPPAYPPVPRQMSSSPEVTRDRPSGDEHADAAPPPAWPAQSPAAPPAWPPAAPGHDESAPPAVPERVVAALDITSEIPRVRRPEPDDEVVPAGYNAPPVPAEPAEAAAAPAAAPAPAEAAAAPAAAPPLRATQHADETMELPIFRELESAWFRTSFDFEFGDSPREEEPAVEDEAAPTAQATEPEPADAGGPDSEPGVPPSEGRPTAAPASANRPSVPASANRPSVPTSANRPSVPTSANRPSVPASANRPAAPAPAGGNGAVPRPATRPTVPADAVWRTAADQGWRAAEAAAQPQVEVTTEAGLPRRTPMAQLVPGGVEKPNAGVQKRSPEQVRGLLSAYHRGVQRGRTDGGAPSAADSPHGGKEQEA